MNQFRDRPLLSHSLEEAVLAALCYSDIFDFPLREHEVRTNIPFIKADAETVHTLLGALVERGRVVKSGDYYCMAGREFLVELRKEKEPLVAEKWQNLRRHLPSFLALPFVKGVLLTGSLAAENPTRQADADLFLVLEHRRMWLGYFIFRVGCRYLKAIDLCPNYAVSEQSLALMYPNLFTSIELSISIPLKGETVAAGIEAANPWQTRILPNAPSLAEKAVFIAPKPTWTGRLLALLVRSPLGWVLNQLEHWRLKRRTQGQYLPNDSVYKPHPPTRQYHIFLALLQRLDRYGVAIPVLRNHIAEQLLILERAIAKWGLAPETRTEYHTPKPFRPLVNSEGKLAKEAN